MKHLLMTSLMAAAAAFLTGCASVASYVDPAYHKADLASIQKVAQPVPARLNVHFQRNGQAMPQVDGEVRGHVERTLNSTGVFALTTDAAAPVITVTANNIADLAAARGKGFATGLSLGLAGSVVDDNYEFRCSYLDNAGREQQNTYLHVIHSTIGNTTAPAGLAPLTPAQAFARVTEDIVLNFVYDLQQAGVIPKQ